ncbi:hypothetical protein HNQ08_002636 [Deinococcus humi]|uniref:AAA domain-containing protein n=1 Tax=Deinococcus humi TaxID=662880 RepID=A0A7W8JUP1_9DEIO|nr:hypothetical protein [Deinococcus humi]
MLDEVQALPHHVLAPAIALLREAAERHDVTVVLCSATQPPFESRRTWRISLQRCRFGPSRSRNTPSSSGARHSAS